MKTERIIQSTRQWVKEVVIGLQLCPFAKPVYDADKIQYLVHDKGDVESVLRALSDVFIAFDHAQSTETSAETSLLILSQGFDNFEDYLDLVFLAESLLKDSGYEGVYQLASFHPQYCFDDAAENDPEKDPANYTNRSPFPMLHLLREASMQKNLQSFAKQYARAGKDIEDFAQDITALNIKKCRELGRTKMQQKLQQCQHVLHAEKEER